MTRTATAAAEEEDYQIKLNEREATNIGIGGQFGSNGSAAHAN